MKVAVPRETASGERRVALVPGDVAKLAGVGIEVLVEKEAGSTAHLGADEFMEAGAKIVSEASALYAEADVVVKIQPPSEEEVSHLREGSALVSFLLAQEEPVIVRSLRERKVTSFSMNLVPRITRAQSIDALSSMSTLAGYKAVLVGAASMGKIMPMLVTAAGTIAPAKVLVLGAGVAGLQAIATARRLGARVFGFDVRPAVKEQVESLGAKFIESELSESAEGKGGYARELSEDAQARNLATIAAHIGDMDLVITTALIPGKPAPVLITEKMLESMKPGAVIVDLAAERGGNCVLSHADQEVVHDGVTILGPTNLPSTIPLHASQMYSRNIATFLRLLVKDGNMHLDFDDEVIAGMCVTHAGEIRHAETRAALGEAAGSEAAGSEAAGSEAAGTKEKGES